MRRWIGLGVLLLACLLPFASSRVRLSAWKAVFALPAHRAVPPLPPEDPPLRAHAEDVADYTLSARLDPPTHTIHGEGTIRFKNTSDVPIYELWLHLYLNAFKNERSLFLREPSAGFRGGARPADWGAIDVRRLALRDGGGAIELWPNAHVGGDDPAEEGDETEARVPLPRPLDPGEVATFDVVWDDKLPAVVERTGYVGTFHFAGQWFPKVARLEKDGTWARFPFHHLAEFYADYGSYDVTIDVPDNFVIGASGPLIESKDEDGRRIERHVQLDVHDFAFTAWDKWKSLRETIAGIDVTLLYPPGFDRVARRELDSVRFALPYFGRLYGAYPYSVLTLVHPPEAAAEAGGMEYPTLITTGGPWYVPAWLPAVELVTVHELGHQWFYGLLGSNEEAWPFLDEGIDSFAEADAMRAMKGPGSELDFAGLRVSDDATQAVFGNQGAQATPVAQPAPAFATGVRYAELVYDRTGAILETLRRVYGDEPFRRALGDYARAYRFLHPGPEELIASFNAAMGGDAAAVLRKALFEEGWVDYAVAEVVSQPASPPLGLFDENGARVTVTAPAKTDGYEGWVLVERRGTLHLPVTVELVRSDGRRERVTWNGAGDTIRLPYRGAVPLAGAIVDPDESVLLDDDRRNNHGSAQAPPVPGAPRMLERLTYWAGLLAQELVP